MQDFSGLSLITSGGTLWLVIDWVIILISLYVVPRNRKPTAGTALLLVIFFFPLLGFLLFLVLGSPKLPKVRRNAQRTLDGIIGKTFGRLTKSQADSQAVLTRLTKPQQALAKLCESLSRLPVLSGNKIEVLPDYDSVINHLVADIDKAERFVHLEYFILVIDEVTEPLFTALGDAVKRGVQTRVLYDSLSTKRYPKWRQMLQRLETDGVTVQAMLPVHLPGKKYVRPDLRNHRKLVIIDGSIGYTGSQNLVRRNYHRKDSIYYDELVIRAQGPIVLELLAVFLTDWYSETGVLLNPKDLGILRADIRPYGETTAQVLPSGPGYDDENNLKLFTSLIHSAEKQITLVNPYFVPDDALMTAITTAARRGVKVTMINSEVMDQWMVGHAQRSFYELLLKSGIRIYLYKAPILLHSKFITVDDDTATIGSSNLDIRSFFLDLEVTLVTYDAAVVKDLRAVEARYLRRSKQLTLKQWTKRPRRLVLLDNIARLTASLQ